MLNGREYHRYSITLKVSGSSINPDQVSKDLGLQPTEVLRKGQVLSRGIPPISTNMWLYSLREADETDRLLDDFLRTVMPLRETLQTLYPGKYTVIIGSHSELFDTGVSLLGTMCARMAAFGAPVEFSIFSQGSCLASDEDDIPGQNPEEVPGDV